MLQLPKWVLSNKYPAFFESESMTAIEQTARVYGAMQQLIDEYNSFADAVNAEIEKYETSTTQDIDKFKCCVTELMENYIKSIDMKMDDASVFMKTNIEETTSNIINSAIDEGRIVITTRYNEETESLEVTGGV